MNDGELSTLRDTLVLHLSKELDEEIETVMETKNISPADIENNIKQLNQNRTQHKKVMRAAQL